MLQTLSMACAVAGGMLLTAITLITCTSLVGRNTTGWSIVGDFELGAAAAGAAIALFMPWCQLRRANIIVDFFTARARQRTTQTLDRIGALLLGMCMALLAWRTGVGGWNAWTNQASSMLLGLPEWITYACMAPALALTAVIALTQALRGADCFAAAAP